MLKDRAFWSGHTLKNKQTNKSKTGYIGMVGSHLGSNGWKYNANAFFFLIFVVAVYICTEVHQSNGNHSATSSVPCIQERVELCSLCVPGRHTG